MTVHPQGKARHQNGQAGFDRTLAGRPGTSFQDLVHGDGGRAPVAQEKWGRPVLTKVRRPLPGGRSRLAGTTVSPGQRGETCVWQHEAMGANRQIGLCCPAGFLLQEAIPPPEWTGSVLSRLPVTAGEMRAQGSVRQRHPSHPRGRFGDSFQRPDPETRGDRTNPSLASNL